jgi:HEAT repeat protein
VEDWRAERDQAVKVLKSSRVATARIEAAQLLLHLAEEGEGRERELAGEAPALIADADERIRRAGVALAARCLPPDEAERVLGARLSDQSAIVRLESAGQLADLARPSSRGLFAAALEDESFNVRFEAARGMAALRHSAGLDVLLEALDKSHLRFRALGALAELGDARALPPVKKLHGQWLLNAFDRTQAAGAMAALGDPEGSKWLLDRTLKKRGLDRPLAVELLGEVKAPGAFERLSEILRDRRDDSRGAAARALGRLGDGRARELLVGMLSESDAPVHLRLDAAEGLCLLGGHEARAQVQKVADAAGEGELATELRAMLEEYA